MSRPHGLSFCVSPPSHHHVVNAEQADGKLRGAHLEPFQMRWAQEASTPKGVKTALLVAVVGKPPGQKALGIGARSGLPDRIKNLKISDAGAVWLSVRILVPQLPVQLVSSPTLIPSWLVKDSSELGN
jgi:hypothetical protein